MSNTENEILTLPEVAAILRVHIIKVRMLVNTGRLQAVRVSPRNVRVKKSDLETFITESSIS